MPEHKEDDGWWTVVNGAGLTQMWLKGDMTPIFIERQAGLLWYVVDRHPGRGHALGETPPKIAGPFEELATAKVHYLFKLRAAGA